LSHSAIPSSFSWELLGILSRQCSYSCTLAEDQRRSPSSAEHIASGGTHMGRWGRKGTPAQPARSANSTMVINRVTGVTARSSSPPSNLLLSYLFSHFEVLKIFPYT
jgi:hypothetical protein